MSELHILLVEDEQHDVLLTEETFATAEFAHTLSTVHDGAAALDYLETHPLPQVMLVDINLPGMSGLELLEVIRADERWHDITVFILTASRSERDIWQSYDLSADAYIAKPVTVSDFAEVAHNLKVPWAEAL